MVIVEDVDDVDDANETPSSPIVGEGCEGRGIVLVRGRGRGIVRG